MVDFNFAKFNIPVKFTRAFDQGKIVNLYQDIYTTASRVSAADLKIFRAKQLAPHFSAKRIANNDTSRILQEMADYRRERLDFHIREMVHLFELYAQSKQQK